MPISSAFYSCVQISVCYGELAVVVVVIMRIIIVKYDASLISILFRSPNNSSISFIIYIYFNNLFYIFHIFIWEMFVYQRLPSYYVPIFSI